MKLFKKVMCFLSSVAICVSMSPIVDLYADELMLNQEDAYNAYLALSDKLDIRMDTFTEKYPDDFGGCYIDNDKLIVLLTNTDSEVVESYRQLCDNNESVLFEKVDYSYKDLKKMEDDAMSELSEVTTVYESYVDVVQNECCIGVDDKYFDAETFSGQNQSAPIKLFPVENKPMSAAMQGGEVISNNAGTCSICFFGKYNGKSALVTCGHLNSIGRTIKYNGTTIGSVVKQNLRTYIDIDEIPSSYGDFSIVDISGSTVQSSNSVKTSNGSITATGTANLVVGLNVKLYGASSTYLSGTVKNTSVSATFTDVEDYSTYKVKGLITVTGSSTVAAGDSGGSAIYTTGAGVNRVAGCITGYRAGVYSYVTPSSYIEASGFSFN